MSGIVHIATVVLLRRDGSALLQLRDDKPGLSRANMWVTPGGHRLESESPRNAALREFQEETGYRCASLHALAARNDDDGVRQFVLHPFWEIYDEVQPVACFEGQRVEFKERSECATLAIPEIVLAIWDEARREFAREGRSRATRFHE